MKKFYKLLATVLALASAFAMIFASISTFAEVYEPSYSIFKSDDFENMTVPTTLVPDYIWNNSKLFWAETNNVSHTTDVKHTLNGNKSLLWKPGFEGDGWSAASVGIGISPNKMAGTTGGFLLKLDFLLKMENMDKLVVKGLDLGGIVKQEFIVNSLYERETDDNTIDKDSETKVTITKESKTVGQEKIDYCRVSFIFRSSVVKCTYFTFTAKATNANAQVYLDDVMVSKENPPKLVYRSYDLLINEGFETGDKLENSIFTGKQTNVAETKINKKSDKQEVIKDEKSLSLKSSTRNTLSTLESKSIELKANYYKLYFKFKADKATSAGVNIIDSATGNVLYDFNIKVSANERMAGVANPLFDNSNFYTNSDNIYVAYGEFEVKALTNIVIQLNWEVNNIKGFVVYDDITLLEQYTKAPSATVKPQDPTKVEGNWTAQYKDLSKANKLGKINLSTNQINAVYSDEAEKELSDIQIVFIVMLAIAVVVTIIISIRHIRKHNDSIKRITGLFLVIILSATCVLATGCVQDNTTTEVPSGYTIVAPEKIKGKLDNPGMGWVILEEPTYGGHSDLGASGEFPEADNVSLSTSWAHIEVEEGNYDFSFCDQVVDYWSSLGKRINLRICTDSLVLTYTYSGTPNWLFEKYNVNYQIVDYTDPGPITTCKVVDISDKNYQHFLDKFLNALYEHYKNNDMVDTVEVRGFGLWGEWHHGFGFENKAERMETLDQILNKYYEAFASSNKMLVVSAAWDPDYTSTNEYYTEAQGDELKAYQNFVNWSCFDSAWRMPGVTFRRDSGGALLRYDLDERILAEAFRSGKRVPLYGEYATNYHNLTTPNNAFDLITGIDDIMYKMRVNYCTVLGWVAVELANIVNQGSTEFIDYANTMLGYRLTVDSAKYPTNVSAGSDFTISTEWSNSAVGIFPYNTALNYHLLNSNNEIIHTFADESFDARLFVQGEKNNFYSTLKVPASVGNGKYKIAVSVPYGEGKIALGMAGETAKNSRIYALGDIEVKDNVKIGDSGVQSTTFDKINDIKFDKNAIYEITFKYLPKFNMSQFYFGTSDCLEFSLVSEKATGTDKRVGLYNWQDISGEVGQKTIVVKTGNADDYKLLIKSINFDEIYVDRVWVEKVGGVGENFEEYSITDAKTIIEPINITTANLTDGNVIDGYGLTLSSPNKKGWHLLAKTDVKNLTLVKGREYTLTFDFKADGTTANGGYYFIAKGDYNKISKINSADFDVVGTWYERADTFATKKTFSFVAESDNETIVFGIKNAGSYFIDNLIISERQLTSTITGVDLGFAHNKVPLHKAGLGIIEDFESGAFQSTGFEWGQFAWGRMTLNPREVANSSETNKISLLGRVEKDAYAPEIDNQWFEFTRSKRQYYPFEANKYYRVQFDYKILKQFESGNVFVFFRDDTLADRFKEAINNPYRGSDQDSSLTTAKMVGVDYHFDYVYKLTNHDVFQFMICMQGLWEISVDNILIEEVTEPVA